MIYLLIRVFHTNILSNAAETLQFEDIAGQFHVKCLRKRSTSKNEMCKILRKFDDFGHFFKNNFCSFGIFFAQNEKYPKNNCFDEKKNQKNCFVSFFIFPITYIPFL